MKRRTKTELLDEIWESWEHLIKDDVARLDYKLFKVLDDAKLHGVKKDVAIQYFRDRMDDVVEYVILHRENDKQQVLRQRKEFTAWQNRHEVSSIAQAARPRLKKRGY